MANITTATARALGIPALLTIFALALPLPAAAQSTVTPKQTQTSAAPATTKTAHRARKFDIDQYITNLHKQLKITPDQEGQWKQVADVMRQNSAAMQAAIKERAQSAKTMSAMENLQSYQKIVQTHEEALQRLTPAFQTLYDSMPDAQKKTADQVFRAAIARAARRQG